MSKPYHVSPVCCHVRATGSASLVAAAAAVVVASLQYQLLDSVLVAAVVDSISPMIPEIPCGHGQ